MGSQNRASHEPNKELFDLDEDIENIDESDELEEKTLSKQKKINLMQHNNTGGRTSNREYNFTNPTADLD